MDMSLSKLQELVVDRELVADRDPEVLYSMGSQSRTQLSNWIELYLKQDKYSNLIKTMNEVSMFQEFLVR